MVLAASPLAPARAQPANPVRPVITVEEDDALDVALEAGLSSRYWRVPGRLHSCVPLYDKIHVKEANDATAAFQRWFSLIEAISPKAL